MSKWAVSRHELLSQILVPGVCSWLPLFASSVSGCTEVHPLPPLWGLARLSPSWSAKRSKDGGSSDWPTVFRLWTTSAALAPGLL